VVSASTAGNILEAVAARLDATLRAAGIADPAAIRDAQGWVTLVLGTVSGRFTIVEAEQTVFLRAIVPIMDMPSDGDLILPLMRELLERNFGAAGPARLAIFGQAVVAAFAVPAVDLSEQDMRSVIDNVMWTARELDEPLHERYGGTSRTRA
jgi:hypothetical protein